MSKKNKKPFVDAGRLESEIYEPPIEVRQEFAEAAELGVTGQQPLIEKLLDHHASSPVLSGGDVDAAGEEAEEGLAVLVAAVLAPERPEHAQLHRVRLPPQPLDEEVVFGAAQCDGVEGFLVCGHGARVSGNGGRDKGR